MPGCVLRHGFVLRRSKQQSGKRLVQLNQCFHNTVIFMNPSPLLQDTVCDWRDNKGFVATDSGELLFFYIRYFETAPQRRPQQGDRRCFQVGQDKHHRPCLLVSQLATASTILLAPTKTISGKVPAIYQIQYQA